MDTQFEERNRKRFVDILFYLAKAQDFHEDNNARSKVYRDLEALYHPNNEEAFRHYYSDIFGVIAQVKQDISLGDIDTLIQNISLVRDGYQSLNKRKDGEPIDIQDEIRKLYDHVMLEIARITYSEAQYKSESGAQQYQELKSHINMVEASLPTFKNIKNDVETMKNDLKESREKIEHSQKEYIAILGIFSAVVLSFTAGLVFSTSVLENVHQGSIYRIAIVCAMIGFVILNLLAALFSFVERIVLHRKRRWTRYLPIYIADILIVLFVVCIFFAWKEGTIEKRNESLGLPSETSTVEIATDHNCTCEFEIEQIQTTSNT